MRGIAGKLVPFAVATLLLSAIAKASSRFAFLSVAPYWLPVQWLNKRLGSLAMVPSIWCML